MMKHYDEKWFGELEGWDDRDIEEAWNKAKTLGDWKPPVDQVVDCSFDEAELLRFAISLYTGELLLIDELPDGHMRLYSIGLNPTDNPNAKE